MATTTTNTTRTGTPWMTTGEAAAYIGVPVSTLYLWRQKRTGPAASKIGKHLRYHVDLVDEWMQRQVEVAS